MARIKKEPKQNHRYPPGTLIAVNLYDNHCYFEAEIKRYGSGNRNKDEAFVQYLDDKQTSGWIDLNVIPVVKVSEDNVLTNTECEGLPKKEIGYMGRRLTARWSDNISYSGTITKTSKDNKNFVYISWDEGDQCWYNLLAETQFPDAFDPRWSRENEKNNAKPTTSKPKKVKKEEKISPDPVTSLFEKQRKENQEKYPVGSLISIDIYGDEHYHEAYVRKHQTNPKKQEIKKNEQWIWVEFVVDKSKNAIDLSKRTVIKMTEENTIRLDKLKRGDERGFLGKRLVVEWADGNKYSGKATRSARDNKHFVFVEYDDGDQCWCDLENESEWYVEGEGPNDDEDAEGSIDGKNATKSKRKGGTKTSNKSQKKAKSA